MLAHADDAIDGQADFRFWAKRKKAEEGKIYAVDAVDGSILMLHRSRQLLVRQRTMLSTDSGRLSGGMPGADELVLERKPVGTPVHPRCR